MNVFKYFLSYNLICQLLTELFQADDITMKSYPSGETWMVFHKNQSGNVWYQSGNLAATFTPSTTSHHCNDAMICILYEVVTR